MYTSLKVYTCKCIHYHVEANLYDVHYACKTDHSALMSVHVLCLVVFGCEHKLIVEHPLWLVVKASAGMELDGLIVLHCQIVPTSFKMSHLRDCGILQYV